MYNVIGFIVFLPIVMMMLVGYALISSLLPVNMLMIYSVMSMPIYGMFFGILIGGCIGWYNKKSRELKLEKN